MKFGRFVQCCLNSNKVGVCVMILMEEGGFYLRNVLQSLDKKKGCV